MLRAVLIDDDATVRYVLHTLLAGVGFEVSEAENGDEGLDLARSLQPDIVLTDILMPERDGFEVVNQLKEASPRSKILVVTGSGPEFLNMALDFGAHAGIEKPFDTDALLALIQELVNP